MNASKNKGKGFERELAKHLAAITGLSFQRVPNSGAFVGGKNFFRTQTLSKEQIGLFEGDIITPKEWDHVRFECKFYKKIAWSKLWQPDGELQLNEWIKQAKQGTRPFWFLCFKINNVGRFVLFPLEQAGPYKMYTNRHWYAPSEDSKETYFIVTMDNFFELNKDVIEGLKNDTDNRNEQAK